MIGGAVLVLALLYVAYRLSLSVRAVKARRAGDRDQADALQRRGSLLFLGLTGALTLCLLAGVLVILADGR